MRNRNTLEFLGAWEMLHNPAFKGVEFAVIKSQDRLKKEVNKSVSNCNQLKLPKI